MTTNTSTIRKALRCCVAAGALLALAACDNDLNIPNLNAPTAGRDATRSSVIVNAQGLLAQARSMTVQGVRTFGIWGRESYDLRPQEPRPHTDNLIGPRDPNSSGNTFFGNNYTAIANARSLLQAVDGVESVTAEEKEAIRGWAKTVSAFAYFQLALAHPEFGAPLEPPDNPTGELAPIVPQEQIYERALALFDEAQTHLRAGGSSFPFQLTPGYQPFNTPTTFLQVNRALKARTLKYMGRWNETLTALSNSFIDEAAPLDLGVYHSYSTTDGSNPFFGSITDYIHPRFRNEAQLQPDGTLDRRALEKTRVIPSVTFFNVTVTEVPTVYAGAEAPFPWITNEELILIRAEANLATGNRSEAVQDVNVIRTRAAGLAPLPMSFSGDLLDEILYNKRYSLLWEGGFTYFDAFQYDRLGLLPRALPDHVVFNRLNFPANECLARNLNTGPCGTVIGIP